MNGNFHREGAGESERVPQEWPTGEQGHPGEANLPPYVRVKQEDEYAPSPLDDYFCKGMDTSDQPLGNRCFEGWQAKVCQTWVVAIPRQVSEKRSGPRWTLNS